MWSACGSCGWVFVERFLHHHHVNEDRLLWPALAQRVPADAAPLVELMEAEHGVIHDCLQRIDELRGRWIVTADPADARHLADRYERLHAALVEHLDAEETRVMPLVEAHLTAPEWAALGEAGRRGFAGYEAILSLGMIQCGAGDALFAQLLADAPAPVRLVMPTWLGGPTAGGTSVAWACPTERPSRHLCRPLRRHATP